MNCPLDYSLCDRTVTVYRKQGDSVLRTVLEGCYYSWQTVRKVDALGACQEVKFLLIVPGNEQKVFPGDRVYDGIGPELEVRDWPRFLPGAVPGVGEVSYARPYHWQGRLCHTEAGRE